MSSNVVVVDSAARRQTVKTTPGTYLSDVLQHACTKFGLDASQYGLKHNNKQVDLSRTIRFSGLPAGAKLSLVQASKSPAAVSVALQLPDSILAAGTPARLTDKFPSNTTIWQIVRRFESGVAGQSATAGTSRNFTQRASPQMTDSSNSGSGRLCYDMPVVHVLGRELGTFPDLSKTLMSLGVNSGSCLLRLSFKPTQQPLEEAIADMQRHFQATEESTTPSDSRGAHAASPATLVSTVNPDEAVAIPNDSNADTPMTGVEDPGPAPAEVMESENLPTLPQTQTQTETPSQINGSSSDNGISIFAPPSSSTPAAASRANFDESDYLPTPEHAKQHQSLLESSTRNQRLLSTAEIEAQRNARASALAQVSEVIVRVRFPDQSQAQRSFSQEATTADLYNFCRELMNRPNEESFSVRQAGEGARSVPVAIPEEPAKKLIRQLEWQGRVLVTVVWGENVASDIRKAPTLKEEYRAKAEQMKVDTAPREAPESSQAESQVEAAPAKESMSAQDKESKMRKFLKGLSKK